MLRKLDEFEVITPSGLGGLYRDKKNGKKWIVKGVGNELAAVMEAFSGTLFQVFAGHSFCPHTRLIDTRSTPEEPTIFMIASEFIEGFTPFGKIQFDSKEPPEIKDKPIDGIELVTMVSVLLREQDFFGNGNTGFDLKASDELKHAPCTRIDFGQTLISTKTKPINSYLSLGAMLKDLDSAMMLKRPVFSREKAWAAMEEVF